MIDIKAIREAEIAHIEFSRVYAELPLSTRTSASIVAMCDEIISLRNGMYNIANQSTDPAIQAFARSYLEAKT